MKRLVNDVVLMASADNSNSNAALQQLLIADIKLGGLEGRLILGIEISAALDASSTHRADLTSNRTE